MGIKEKLIAELKEKPKDFTFKELETLLDYLGFELSHKGKTSGSRVMFVNKNNGLKIIMHRPHGRKVLLVAQVKQILDYLEREKLI